MSAHWGMGEPMNARLTFVALLSLGLAACSSPTLPDSGTPTPYDGLWSGDLLSPNEGCDGLTISGEVRYGKLVAEVHQKGEYKATVWGDLDDGGVLSGDIGKMGISAGKGFVTFMSDGQADGLWSAPGCEGDVVMTRK